MSKSTDQENPSGNDDNTDATNDNGENNYFPAKFLHPPWIKSTPPNLLEENERCDSH